MLHPNFMLFNSTYVNMLMDISIPPYDDGLCSLEECVVSTSLEVGIYVVGLALCIIMGLANQVHAEI